jgi:hypothetical protein
VLHKLPQPWVKRPAAIAARFQRRVNASALELDAVEGRHYWAEGEVL